MDSIQKEQEVPEKEESKEGPIKRQVTFASPYTIYILEARQPEGKD